MTLAISHQPRRQSSATAPSLGRRQTQAAMVLVAVAAALAGYLATDPIAAGKACAQSGGDLTRLLRAMAAIKLVMALAATSAVLWRLEAPIRPKGLAVYLVACASMMAGPGLIWNVAQLGMGALLLHAGLIATLVMLWRDPAVARRISDALAARRGPQSKAP